MIFTAPRPTPRRHRWSAVSAGAVLILCAGQTAATAGSTSHPRSHLAPSARSSARRTAARTTQLSGARAVGPLRWVRVERGCAAPRPGQLSCSAVKLAPSHRGAAGAVQVPAASSSRPSASRSSSSRSSSDTVSAGPAGGYTPADLASAYGYRAAVGGTTQTVAIVDAYNDPNALADLNAFDRHYHLPAETATSFRKVDQAGHTSPLPHSDPDWSGEIALDIETVRSVCNHCKIILVEATSPTAANLAAAVNIAVKLHATEVSNSYGGPETDRSSQAASVIAAYNHPGVVITASTGDDGWYDWDVANDGQPSSNAPSVPAALPTVVAVGGTALSLNRTGTRQAETVWNENGLDDEFGVVDGADGASGGGCSLRYAAQSWQLAAAHYATTGCGSRRMTGDIAAVADPFTGFDVYDTYENDGWDTFGGTSLSSPLIAAMWALAGGSGGVRYPAESLYDNLAHHPTSVFDVRSGGNSWCGGDTPSACSAVLLEETTPPTGNPNDLTTIDTGTVAGLQDCSYPSTGPGTVAANAQCNAKTGYDGPSGVGTPHGLAMFKPVVPTVAITHPATLLHNHSATFSVSGFTDPFGAKARSHSWSWGDHHYNAGMIVKHTYTKAGTYTITLTVPDTLGRVAHASVRVTVR